MINASVYIYLHFHLLCGQQLVSMLQNKIWFMLTLKQTSLNMSNLLLSATGIFFFLGTVMHSDVPEIFLFLFLFFAQD